MKRLVMGLVVLFGLSYGLVSPAADFDGDGTNDVGIFREASGLWAIKALTRVYFGGVDDWPMPGDYDGDGTIDVSIFRPSSGLWATRDLTRMYFGGPGDEPLIGLAMSRGSYGGGEWTQGTGGVYYIGNVGIGTDSPQNELDVAGGVAVGGNFAGLYSAPSNGMIVEGYLGIGTNAPADDLHVETAGSTYGRIASQTSHAGLTISKGSGGSLGFVQFAVNGGTPWYIGEVYDNDFSIKTSTTGNEFHLTRDGKVGIGTTGPSQKLDVAGGIQIGYTADAEAGAIRWDGANFQGYNGSSWCSFGTSGGGGSLWSQSGSDIYYNAGKVGIGTSSPSAKMEVSYNSALIAQLISTASYGYMRFMEGASGRGSVGYGDANQLLANALPDSFAVKSFNALHLAVDGDALKGVTVIPGGKVGIGTTAPNRKLTVQDSGNAYLGIKGQSGACELLLGAADTNGGIISTMTDHNLEFRTNNDAKMTITNGGNVGIGTTWPVNKLDLNQAIDGNINLGITDNDGFFAMFGVNDEGNYASLSHGFIALPWYFDTIVMKDGNVGIGTTSPEANLDVNGNAAISGRLTIGEVTTGGKRGLDEALYIHGPLGVFSDIPILPVAYFEAAGDASVVFATNNSDAFFAPTGYFYNEGSGPVIQCATGPSQDTIFEVLGNGRTVVKVLEITGGADLVESFDTGEESCDPGTVLVIDDVNQGRLKPSYSAYDKKVAGVVSGAGGVNPGIRLGQEGLAHGNTAVAMSGRVYCLTDASNGPIRPGDMLTTSDVPGHAMKVTDYEKAQGAVIGKAMSSLEEGQDLVLVLVTLQ